MISDPIADMLTRIRNALRGRHTRVDIPISKLRLEIARILKEEGYIQSFKRVDDQKQGVIRIVFRKGPGGEDAIEGLARVSKPGCRIYCRKEQIPRVRGGLGTNILSTPKGLMTGTDAARAGLGGEILCNVW